MTSRRAGRLPYAAVVTAVLLDWGCASHPPSSPTAPRTAPVAAPCVIGPDSFGPPRTVTVVFADSVAAQRARLADSLRTPVRFDCTGRPLPGLATAWSGDSSGKYWTLEFGAGPQASGGEEMTAARVATAWRTAPRAAATLELGGVESMLPLDERRLAVGFSSAHRTLPAIFADPALGLPRGGTVPNRLVATVSGGDLRDALDGDADVVVSSEPLLLDYARQRPELTAVPLPWSRSYVLVVPPGRAIEGVIPSDTAAFRAGLARDAVHAEARPAVAPFWWDTRRKCSRQPGAEALSPLPSNAIAYQRGDASARELAERLVALADTQQLTARGYPADELAAALREGRERAYVLAVPSRVYVPCRETADWPAGSVSVALVESRARAVIRRGTPVLVVDWDGTLHAADSSAAVLPSP
jgi:hypothetical protein